MKRAWVLAVLVTGTLALLPTAAPAYPPITCGRVAVAGTTYIFRTHGPTCRYATHWLKVYIVYKHGPKGYACRAYGADIPAYCRGTHRRYFFANSAG